MWDDDAPGYWTRYNKINYRNFEFEVSDTEILNEQLLPALDFYVNTHPATHMELEKEERKRENRPDTPSFIEALGNIESSYYHLTINATNIIYNYERYLEDPFFDQRWPDERYDDEE